MNPSEDPRNLIDTYKGRTVEDIKTDLSKSRVSLEIAIENLERDFNMGTIVRTANAFNVKAVHVVGRRQWNKRGAMKTDAYLDIVYHGSVEEFMKYVAESSKQLVAIDIVPGSIPLHTVKFKENTILAFGSEQAGLSDELLQAAEKTVHIEQTGSTRSVNVGVAAGIAMYAWVNQHSFNE